MANVDLADQLIELVGSPSSAQRFVSDLDDKALLAVAPTLKGEALFYLQRDTPVALAIAELILNIGEWRDIAQIRALGLQTKAIVLTLSQREFEEALNLFAKSEEIYRRDNNELEIAVGQVSRIWALACLQRYDQAFTVSEWTAEVLIRYEDYRSLAALKNNLAAIYGRRGHDAQALELRPERRGRWSQNRHRARPCRQRREPHRSPSGPSRHQCWRASGPAHH